MYFVHVTGSVVGLAVLWGGVLHIIFKDLSYYMYVSMCMSCYVRVPCTIVFSVKADLYVSSQTITIMYSVLCMVYSM